MSRRVIVVGAGGHGKVVVGALLSAGEKVVGLVDPRTELWSLQVLGVPVLGGDEQLDALVGGGDLVLANGVGSTGRATARRDVFERLRARGFLFSCVVHSSAVISADVDLGAGAQVMAGAVIQPGVGLGEDCIVNTAASVDHDCLIGEHAHIAPGATLCGHVYVGALALVGAGASVRQGLRIGKGSVVGAGAVVVADVPEGVMVAGNPARPRQGGV